MTTNEFKPISLLDAVKNEKILTNLKQEVSDTIRVLQKDLLENREHLLDENYTKGYIDAFKHIGKLIQSNNTEPLDTYYGFGIDTDD